MATNKFLDLAKNIPESARPDIEMFCRSCIEIRKAYRPNQIKYITKTSVCSICGWIYGRNSISDKYKEMIFKIDAHECVYCAAKRNLTIEHIYPHFYGGSDEPDNLVTACRKCNYSRNNALDHQPFKYGRFRG